MSRKVNYDFLDCANKMPALSHVNSRDNSDIKKSKVAQWLVNQPEVMQKIFDMAKNKKVIKYDPTTQTWRGADCDGD